MMLGDWPLASSPFGTDEEGFEPLEINLATQESGGDFLIGSSQVQFASSLSALEAYGLDSISGSVSVNSTDVDIYISAQILETGYDAAFFFSFTNVAMIRARSVTLIGSPNGAVHITGETSPAISSTKRLKNG